MKNANYDGMGTEVRVIQKVQKPYTLVKFTGSYDVLLRV